jgi:hypothetical protein
MRLHIVVTPDPDEPLVVAPDWITDGRAWLDERVADGTFEACEAFEETGGYVILSVPDGTKADGLRAVEKIFSDYPLLSTITMTIHRLVDLDTGFGTLKTANAEKRRITT